MPLNPSGESLDPVQTDIRSSSNALSPHGVLWGDLANPRYTRESRNVDDGIPDDLYERMIFLASQLMDSYLRYDSLYVGIRISYPKFGKTSLDASMATRVTNDCVCIRYQSRGTYQYILFYTNIISFVSLIYLSPGVIKGNH